ncbi:sigma-54 interaction domain-containing protein [Halalkalibacter alkalisediminis]|uniref:Sigma-54 interaction domain-containing protein n=1 Tax=Halalkalibacter alkalisediminis TaxID=935616 RepID=A0ABV6NCD6_9BACI|nr:sigma 54-interacting transcriptional regulator [Halalkalibacter alkalisediminis]
MLMIDFDKLEGLSNFDNILVTDANGIIIFYDLADLNVLRELDSRPEEFLGKKITTFYRNLSDDNSTVMRVLNGGVALCNVKQQMITKKGFVIESVSSTYPIKENDSIIGAIEFSKHFYAKENIHSLDKYAGHKVYRKNNTIYTIEDIITGNPKMEEIKSKINKVAQTNSTVLIVGRTGTGKEVVAQAIHNLSDRYNKPFISLNCGAIPDNLLESTLFGTTKGSFTGSQDMPGLFEQADGGTLFLDEINSLDISLQVKLLKAIEEKMIRRVGGKKNISVNIRVISATNEDPEWLLAEKRLREDLFYRLGVVQIDLPLLIERKEDIEVLLHYYMNFYNDHMSLYIEGVEKDVIECFRNYNWPGNIRELKNAVETAYNNVSSNVIMIHDIPNRIVNFRQTTKYLNTGTQITSLKDSVENYEKEIIVSELNKANGIIAETARRLGTSKQSLKYKMDKYKLR